MTQNSAESEEFLNRAACGDLSAVESLFSGCRDRLRKMVAVHMDPRLFGRFDPSDVIQDALMEAASRLPRFLKERPVPFYPWLRKITLERLIDLNRLHLAEKRSPDRELPTSGLPDESVWRLAGQLAAMSDQGPVDMAIVEEQRRRLHHALGELPENDREILILRYLEQLSTADSAAVLGIQESAVKMRHLRALERIRELLQ